MVMFLTCKEFYQEGNLEIVYTSCATAWTIHG